MGTRELIILILGLAIVGVVLRGLYVAINARRGQIKLAIDKNIPQDIDLDALEMSELPNGGARVVSRRVEAPAEFRASHEQGLDPFDSELVATDEQPIPVLMDTVEIRAAADSDRDFEETQYSHREAAESEEGHPGPVYGNEFDEFVRSEEPEEAHLEPESLAVADEELLFDYQDASPGLGNGFDESDSTANKWSELVDDEARAVSEEAADASSEVAAEEVWYQAEDSLPAYEIGGDSLNRADNYAQENVEPSAEPEEESEAKTFEDGLGSFSFSAGERIGQHKITPEPIKEEAESKSESTIGQQPELFDPLDDYDVEEATALVNHSVSEGDLEEAGEELDVASNREKGLSSRLKDFVPTISRPAFLSNAAPTNTHSEAEDSPALAVFEKEMTPAVDKKKAEVVDIKDAPPPASESNQSTLQTEPSEVIVLNLMAGEGYEYYGDDLLQVLLSQGLSFGGMNIFHRHAALATSSSGSHSNPIVFSLANIVNPGTFDLNKISEFRTPGVSLFLALPSPINNIAAFEDMLDVAQDICSRLGGELRDDQRNRMTAQTIEHYRQRIRDFELLCLKSASLRS